MLTVDDFRRFVAEVHGGRKPFPWQVALLESTLAAGCWPGVIDVPTGLGKTSVLDVAVFLAAMRRDLGRRRMFFVVDRRIVVDEAYEHAKCLADALDGHGGDQHAGPVSQCVAEALRRGDDGPVLEVARMRGGVTWDWLWLERPDRYAIVTGTVDQIGSRLLFRGYGVTDYARSIDAALVGTDSLIVVDEAHLAEALTTTLTSGQEVDQQTRDTDGRHDQVRPPVLVTMSATSADTAADGRWVHRISAADEVDPTAGKRLRAAKRMRLVEVKATRTTAATAVPEALASIASKLAVSPDSGQVVGVVVNTVARAREVFTRLGSEVESILLTGRIRPVDRDRLLGLHYRRIGVSRTREGTPMIVVATQTIEVGANVDFDALVTESAPLPNLVQRLGRLNRLGGSDDAPAFVVQDSTVDDDDPVYGPARLATWTWLATLTDPVRGDARLNPTTLIGGLDVSPAALRALVAVADSAELRPVQPCPPVLTAATLDCWARTSPAPHPDPPVAPYLHGIDTDVRPDVTVVWRSGLDLDRPDRWRPTVDLLPPVSGEGLAVPIGAVRRWLLAAQVDPQASDQENRPGADGPDDDVTPARAVKRARLDDGRVAVLRYRSSGDAELVDPGRLRPGDLIVVPGEYGGSDQFGWHPADGEPVHDVADLAWRRGGPAIRLGPGLKRALAWHDERLVEDPPTVAALSALLAQAVADTEARQPSRERSYCVLVDDLCEAIGRTDADLSKRLRALSRGLRVSLGHQLDETTDTFWSPGYDVLLTAKKNLPAEERTPGGTSSSPDRRQIQLDGHQEAVADRAAEFASNLELSDHLVRSVRMAARWHDEGKRDPRFQAMLHGGEGEGWRAELGELLAKSGMDPADRRGFRTALRGSGYPPGGRHEALSAQIAAMYLSHDGLGAGLDAELVVHLVASHHGRSRPLLPPVVDANPVEVPVSDALLTSDHAVDWEAPARFERLHRKYGRWGLALLESVVRLADIWCSKRDECADDTGGPVEDTATGAGRERVDVRN